MNSSKLPFQKRSKAHVRLERDLIIFFGKKKKTNSATGAAELLFREDTIYTEMANEFVREHGMEYLRKALKGPLKKVTELASSEDFDIDPTRVPRIEDQKANTSRLLEAADLILDSLHQRMEKYLPPYAQFFSKSVLSSGNLIGRRNASDQFSYCCGRLPLLYFMLFFFIVYGWDYLAES